MSTDHTKCDLFLYLKSTTKGPEGYLHKLHWPFL